MSRLHEETYHIPVMLQECLDALQLRSGGVYVDGTLGGGGHTSAILSACDCTTNVVAFDADERAIEHCKRRFSDELAKGGASRLTLVHDNFQGMPRFVQSLNQPINGVLLDLGVSSYQFDHHERGFSFRMMAPLDMRFAPEGITAAHIVNTESEPALAKIFRDYGDEPQAWRLAKAIAQRRNLAALKTTADLRALVVQVIPPHHQPKTLARIFQALRIAVNDELGVLERTIVGMIPLLAKGARIVVMSYHSGEDRIVKNVFRNHRETLRIVTKKAIEASDEELSINPRARSARLRVAESIG